MSRSIVKRTKSLSRLRDGDQLPTHTVPLVVVMKDPKFQQGVEDVRAGRGYPTDYDCWGHDNDRWNYSRGRQWATAAPRHVRLKVNGEITIEALAWYRAAEIL